MFSTSQHTDLENKKDMLNNLFEALVSSSKLATEANHALNSGTLLLIDKATNLSQLEFDTILTGTLLYAFVGNDWKYWRAKHLHIAMPKMHDELEKAFAKAPTEIRDPQTRDILQKRILYIGQKVLIDKEIMFDGQFTIKEDIKAIIQKELPFLHDDYFASYGIQPTASNTPKM